MFYDYEGQALIQYSKAPLEVLHDKNLKDFSKLLYFELYSIYDQNKHSNSFLFIKDETLAEKLGVVIATIKKAMKDLEDNNFIRRETSNFDKGKKAKIRHIYLKQLSKNDSGKISYIEFPKSIYFEGITSFQKLLLIELISLDKLFANEQNGVFASNQYMAERFNKGRRTIIRNIQELEDKKYIIVDRTINQRVIYLEHEMVFHLSVDDMMSIF